VKQIFAAVLMLVCAVTVASAADPDRMRIGYIAEPAHGLHFLAKEKGYFKEEGIDAELYQFSTTAEGLTALKAGRLDVGTFGTAAPLLFISKGSEFTIFGGMMIGGQAIIARPENVANLKKLENYRGKKIGMAKLTTGDVIFRSALLKAGMDWRKNDYTVVEFPSVGNVVEAVKKGAVDAGIVFSPHFTLAEKQGLKVAHFIEDFYPDYTCCRLDANTKDFNERKDAFKRFLIAEIRAYRFYRTSPEETVQIFTKALKIDEEVVRKDTYTRKAFECNPDPLKKGTIDFWRQMRAIGYIPNDYPIEKHINTEVYRQALETVIKREPKDKIYQEMLAFYKKNNQ
jgi:NitT/TauT family transport system substrate-binding protein